MPLYIHTSNRMEKLLDALASTLLTPLSSPFTPEIIVMQSKGMQRWLSMELAERFGIWGNGNYPFPNHFISQLFNSIMPDVASSDTFEPEVMTWKIFHLLLNYAETPNFEPIRRYLVDDKHCIKQFQLAQKIADTFDQYTLYRPEMLSRWEKNLGIKRGEEWQAELWQKLVEINSGKHRGELKNIFCSLLQSHVSDHFNFPERISLFGISYLPTYHLEIIAAAAEVMEINLFLLSPTREYWSDIKSRRAVAIYGESFMEGNFEGNPLLASIGKLGRDFSSVTLDLGSIAAVENNLYVEPEGDSLINVLQRDILNLTGGDNEYKRIIRGDDSSLQIHSCHTEMREIEILHDQLLAMFERENGLEPRDVLVMTPDIESYAPYITAVFETVSDQNLRIPYSIADRKLASEGEIASVLLKILELPESRITSVQLLDLMSLTPVRIRFDISVEELATIRGWVEKTRICWGFDEKHRLDFDLPPYSPHTWREGMRRLMLGYSTSDDDGELFNNLLPFDGMEGGIVLTLGKLYDFIAVVKESINELKAARTLERWCQTFCKILSRIITQDDNTTNDTLSVFKMFEELSNDCQLSGCEDELTFQIVRSLIKSRLEEEEFGGGFINGGVTFCAMIPMRSIPFKVIAMIGMNDGAFPRQNNPTEFNLIAAEPRKGDRSLRDEDRYLFLETILSVRNRLYISYLGQSVRDNSELPPSVLVSELLDSIDRSFTTENGESIEKRFVTRHRLQGFSSDYFSHDSKNSGLFSYSNENCSALIEQQSALLEQNSFIHVPLPEAGEEWRDVPIYKLIQFITNPSRFFCENRLEIRLEKLAEPLEEREPFDLDALAKYGIDTLLLKASIEGESSDKILCQLKSQSVLPPLLHGELLFKNEVEKIAPYTTIVKKELSSAAGLDPLDVELSISGFKLHGRLENINADFQYIYRPAKQKAKDLITAWIYHLSLCAMPKDGYPNRTAFIALDKISRFEPVEDPESLLQKILDLYWLGLQKPLPFFPESSLSCANNKNGWDISKRSKSWKDDDYNNIKGECSDPYFKLCFGKEGRFDDEFEQISRTILEPLLQSLK